VGKGAFSQDRGEENKIRRLVLPIALIFQAPKTPCCSLLFKGFIYLKESSDTMIEVLDISKPRGEIPHDGTLEIPGKGDELLLLGESQTLRKIQDYVANHPEVAEGSRIRESEKPDLVKAFELYKDRFKTRGKMIAYMLEHYYSH
jgi:hypothetical protein